MDRRDRIVYRDAAHRSDRNSQSQNSDQSFPAPVSQPPRPQSPPPHSDELSAALPYFHTAEASRIAHFEVPIPQVSTGSNTSLEHMFTYRASRKLEIGDSSKKKAAEYDDKKGKGKRSNSDVSNEEESRKQKQKVIEHMMGGILKPPKKR